MDLIPSVVSFIQGVTVAVTVLVAFARPSRSLSLLIIHPSIYPSLGFIVSVRPPGDSPATAEDCRTIKHHSASLLAPL